MRIDDARRARSPWAKLLTALLDQTEGQGELVQHTERAWSSATFSGARHTVTIAFNGLDAIAAGETFVEAIPLFEFSAAGHLAVDAQVTAVAQQALPEPRLTVTAEFLLLEST